MNQVTKDLVSVAQIVLRHHKMPNTKGNIRWAVETTATQLFRGTGPTDRYLACNELELRLIRETVEGA